MALDLEFFKGRLNAEEILNELGIQIAFKNGKQVMCHCPDFGGNHMNGDANPSFGFNEEKLVYNCFVCGGGTLFRLVEEMLDLDREGAERWLLTMSNLEPADEDTFNRQIEAILTPHEEAEPDPTYPPDALFQFNRIHPYLYERGLTKDVIIEHQIGFDEDHLAIIIPHFFMGQLKGWQTRHLVEKDGVFWCERCQEAEPKKKVPKYKNTPNFPKVNTLFGYDQAKVWCEQNGVDEIIVVESPFTVLYLKSLGFKNVVATFGQFNPEQGSLLWPWKRVLFWPDNDDAGRQNAARAIRALWRYVELYLIPPVDRAKGDAADLDRESIVEHLKEAVPSALYRAIPNTK